MSAERGEVNAQQPMERLGQLPLPESMGFQCVFPRGENINVKTHGAIKVNVRANVQEIRKIDIVQETFTAIFVLEFNWVDPALRNFETKVCYWDDQGCRQEETGRTIGHVGYNNEPDLIIETLQIFVKTPTDKTVTLDVERAFVTSAVSVQSPLGERRGRYAHLRQDPNRQHDHLGYCERALSASQKRPDWGKDEDWGNGEFSYPDWTMMNVVDTPQRLEGCCASTSSSFAARQVVTSGRSISTSRASVRGSSCTICPSTGRCSA
mmetsp:Transcript_47670/g.153349  ORF Transcript_47670/g.153349 Transcript_47670/m.153349 type:complete len:265 (-) Transcript_47670:1460-2254(-)